VVRSDHVRAGPDWLGSKSGSNSDPFRSLAQHPGNDYSITPN